MQNTNTSIISFDDVSLQIANKKILNNISLTIPHNSIVGFLGPNGAGKTTLLSLIIGLIKQTSGEITVLGEKLSSRNAQLKQQLGVVFQETSLYEELTVEENLLFFASLYAVQKPKERTKEVLDLLGILDRAKDRVSTLSGGLKRRTAIARALLHNPKLLVVDEPTLGVDVETRHTIWEHLKFLKSQGHTIIVASNYLDEAQAICDTVMVLNEGNLLISDSPQNLIEKTGHSLDIESSKESAEKIANILKKTDGIIRVETTPSGLSVFLKGDIVQDSIVNTIVKTAPVNGFRFRPADLAEVFKALKQTSSDTNT